MIENPLAQRLLRGDFVSGDTVIGQVKDGALVFSKA
jgi:ATP-dependent Clp protease ATP-binding subunit ClpB